MPAHTGILSLGPLISSVRPRTKKLPAKPPLNSLVTPIHASPITCSSSERLKVTSLWRNWPCNMALYNRYLTLSPAHKKNSFCEFRLGLAIAGEPKLMYSAWWGLKLHQGVLIHPQRQERPAFTSVVKPTLPSKAVLNSWPTPVGP